MNKICTSIEQSKKLIELGIDVSTADMLWTYDFVVNDINGLNVISEQLKPEENDIPAWSLSALLGLMPKSIKGITASDEAAGWPQYFYYPRLLLTDKEMWQCIYKEYNGAGASKCWTIGESPIDACVEMILKLHELNLS